MFNTAQKYHVIYADPPWAYNDKCHAGKRGAGYKYNLMSSSELQDMGSSVHQISGDHCMLFMWATMPLLPRALRVMESWGFVYKTVAFTWVKTTKHGKLHWGMGNWTRANPELCLLGVKGKPKRVSAAVHSVVLDPVRKHSQKPGTVRDRIVQLCGDVPRIELFARDTAAGWDSWGDGVTF